MSTNVVLVCLFCFSFFRDLLHSLFKMKDFLAVFSALDLDTFST